MAHHIPKPPPKWVMLRIDNDIAYYPLSGNCIWIASNSTRIKIGQIAGTIQKGYIVIHFKDGDKNHSVFAYHIASYKMRGKWPPQEMDHKRGNKADNRWNKLRLSNRSKQMQNKGIRIDNTTGVTGVYTVKNKFRGQLDINGQVKRLGYFDTLAATAKARREAEKKYFGKFRYRRSRR